MGPMWGFGWIFRVIGLLIFLFFVVCIVRMIAEGGPFMCMGLHHHDSEETSRLRRDSKNYVNK
jgi:hypothetical protein